MLRRPRALVAYHESVARDRGGNTARGGPASRRRHLSRSDARDVRETPGAPAPEIARRPHERGGQAARCSSCGSHRPVAPCPRGPSSLVIFEPIGVVATRSKRQHEDGKRSRVASTTCRDCRRLRSMFAGVAWVAPGLHPIDVNQLGARKRLRLLSSDVEGCLRFTFIFGELERRGGVQREHRCGAPRVIVAQYSQGSLFCPNTRRALLDPILLRPAVCVLQRAFTTRLVR